MPIEFDALFLEHGCLQVIEFEEWGNPAEKEYYDYIKSYSPVDNIQKTAYPNILITAGLHDPRVGEPAICFRCSALAEGPFGSGTFKASVKALTCTPTYQFP